MKNGEKQYVYCGTIPWNYLGMVNILYTPR